MENGRLSNEQLSEWWKKELEELTFSGSDNDGAAVSYEPRSPEEVKEGMAYILSCIVDEDDKAST